MPDPELPKAAPVDSSRSQRPVSLSRRQQSRSSRVAGAASFGKPVIVIGSPSDIPRALAHPAVVNGQFSVAAAVAVDTADEAAEPSTGDIERLETLMRSERVSTVLMAGPVGSRLMQYIADLAALHDCDLLAVMPTDVLAEHEPAVVWTGDTSFVELAAAKRHVWGMMAKRAVDVVVAIVGLVLTMPVMAIAAAAIWLESAGSPVFRHERVGLRGKRFLCLKLRTMRVGAEDRLRADSAMYEEYRRHHFKIPEDRDPRVTKLGRWLRRTSIDELPQLWNVLVGEMSLVGPRPVVTEELELYGLDKNVMLSVRPGITGAWAVAGRQSLGYPDRCAIELKYVRGWRFSGDVLILAKTALVVARSAVPSKPVA